MIMHIVQVISSINREDAGPSYSVRRLCEVLARLRTQVELHVLNPVPESLHRKAYALRHYPSVRAPFFSSLGISPGMSKGLDLALEHANIAHNHGLWQAPNIYASSSARRYNRKLVISPRGMLAPWALARSRWKKRIMWHAAQKRALFAADCLHATAESEYADIRANGLKLPVAIIPNGVDMPSPRPMPTGKGRRRLLFLARIHPVKGVDVLLRAWRRIESSFKNWELWIAGPDSGGYLGRMQALADDLRITRVTFCGPAYGEEKTRLFYDSDLYVLPTHTENFGLTIAEALAHGLPAIVTRGAPWQGLETHGCGWWIDHGEEPLAECLKDAMERGSDSLLQMGGRGRDWMERDFSWQAIGEQMYLTYRWLVTGGDPPEWVRCES